MKRIVTILAVASIAASAAIAADGVDIGVPASEFGHNLVGWGPPEPATHGGSYGGIDECRAIWFDNGDPTNPDGNWATLDLDFGMSGDVCLAMMHLEGLADDSFDVYVGTTHVYTHADVIVGQEIWVWTAIPLTGYTGTQTVKFVATGAQWSGFSTYGQMCFAEVAVGECFIANEATSWSALKMLYR
jgi:hypothetical protein